MLPKDASVGTPNHSLLHEVVLTQASRPSEKRRGSWSFLTWSFFLAQTFAAEQFFGSGARAAQNDDASATRSNDQSQILPDEIAAGAAGGPGGQEAGESRTIEQQTPLDGIQGLLLPGVSQAASDYSATDSVSRPNGSESSGGGSSAGSGQSLSSLTDSQPLGDSQTIPPAADLPASPPDGTITAPVSANADIDIGIGIGPNLDTDLDLDLNLAPVAESSLGMELSVGDGADLGLDLGLGSTLAHSLALDAEASLDVNLLGGDASLDLALGVGATSPLLNASAEPVTDLAGLSTLDSALGRTVGGVVGGPSDQSTQDVVPDGFVTSVISNTTGLALQQNGIVSSGDVIAFSGGTTSNLADDLFTSGRYTDYGLELHTGGSPGFGNVIEVDSDIVDEGPSSLIDSSEADGASTQSRSPVGDNLDTSHLGVPSSVEELTRSDAI